MKTKHHIFTYTEVRHALVDILGEPETEEQHRHIQKEAMKIWKRLPLYELELEDHKNVHKKQKERHGSAMRWFNDEIQKMFGKEKINREAFLEINKLALNLKTKLNGSIDEDEENHPDN